MTTGAQLHEKFTSSMRQLAKTRQAAASKIDDLKRSQVRLRQEMNESVLALARHSLMNLSNAEVTGLELAQRIAGSALNERDAQKRDLMAKRVRVDEDLVVSEATRQVASSRLRKAQEALAGAEAAIENALHEDPQYQQLGEECVRLDAQYAAADAAAIAAAEELKAKKVPYLEDPLFSYLWKRNFGLPSYRAWVVVEAIDGWVARLCGYRSASTNFKALQSLPVALREQARLVGRSQFQARDEKNTFQKRFLEARGLQVHVLENQMAREALESANKAHEDNIQRLTEVDAGLRRLARWEDQAGSRLVDTLADRLAKLPLDELTTITRLTVSTEDDALLENVRSILAKTRAIESDIAPLNATIKDFDRRIENAEKVRSTLSSRGVNTDRHVLRGGDETIWLDSLMSGSMNASQILRDMEGSIRYVPPPPPPVSRSRDDDSGFGGFSTGGGFSNSDSGFSTGGGFGND